MGIDEERIAKGDVNFNFDLSNLKNFFQPGMDFNELFKNMGVDVRVDASPVEIKTPDGDEKDDMVLPADDVYLEGWNMTITVDFAKKELEQDQVELNLIDGGMLVEVHRTTQLAPIARIELPHACEDVVDFTLNNGILDITLRLIPPEDAFAALPPSEDGDDTIPLSGDIAIDLADDDDDDDDDDGGIPIL
jgi:HSP20 family molecular chaperone IbpA